MSEADDGKLRYTEVALMDTLKLLRGDRREENFKTGGAFRSLEATGATIPVGADATHHLDR